MFARFKTLSLLITLLLTTSVATNASAHVSDALAEGLWQKLVAEHGRDLGHWIDAADGDPSAVEVLQAFTDLVGATTAPGGFWRRDVPAWLGCRSIPSRACERLRLAQVDFMRWDAVVDQISQLPDRDADRFLAAHAAEMVRYLDYYVPARPSAKAMRETGFFTTRLAPHFAAAVSPDLLF